MDKVLQVCAGCDRRCAATPSWPPYLFPYVPVFKPGLFVVRAVVADLVQVMRKPPAERSQAALCVVDVLATAPIFKLPGWSWPMRCYLYRLLEVVEFAAGTSHNPL
jgi:hypothetical protein